jgi:hypothetical protein
LARIGPRSPLDFSPDDKRSEHAFLGVTRNRT